jgi:hypothetical protein
MPTLSQKVNENDGGQLANKNRQFQTPKLCHKEGRAVFD